MSRGPEVTVRANLRVESLLGLHARTSTAIARLVAKFSSRVTISRESRSADGASIIGLLGLNVPGGAEVAVEATGVDAEEVVEALRRLLADAARFDG